VDLLLKAWSRISPRFPQTGLRIAGDGEQRELLESMASDLGIRQSVHFLGRKSQDDLRSLYRNAKAVVLPSRREGLPLSLLEAGAAGAICVGSRTAGIPEIIDEGITGYVVDAERPEELGGGIAKTLALTPAARREMKQAAQTAIRRRFSEEQMIASYLELFSSLREGSRRP
jgi:glycosyltransferase involved in cell wall biosynthesis